MMHAVIPVISRETLQAIEDLKFNTEEIDVLLDLAGTMVHRLHKYYGADEIGDWRDIGVLIRLASEQALKIDKVIERFYNERYAKVLTQ